MTYNVEAGLREQLGEAWKEVEALRKDAERYRALRRWMIKHRNSNNWFCGPTLDGRTVDLQTDESVAAEFDARVDAALRREG